MSWIDLISEEIPAYIMIAAIIVVVMYSMRPCPKGCSRSAFLLESLVPTMVMIDEIASERLFTASRVTAIELDKMPTAALNAASATLAAMPMALVRIMALSRSEEVIVTCDWVIINLAFCNVRKNL